MENKNNDVEEVAMHIYEYAANLMIKEKKSEEETIKILVDQGLDKESASVIVGRLEQQILEQQITDAKKEKARKNMLYGALWCIGGIVVTAVTYSASSGGGTYVVAWGAILFGAIQFIRGLVGA